MNVLNKLVLRLVSVLLVLIVFETASAQTPVANKPSAAIIKTPSVASSPSQAPGAYDSGTKVNYVRVWEAVAPISDPSVFSGAGYQQVKQSTEYIDGLGRPLQRVSRQATPGSTPKDIVMPVVYDPLGREVYRYLPYVQNGTNASDGSFKLDPFGEQDNFYKSVYRDATDKLMYDGEQFLYSKTQYESSPLNRVVKSNN